MCSAVPSCPSIGRPATATRAETPTDAAGQGGGAVVPPLGAGAPDDVTRDDVGPDTVGPGDVGPDDGAPGAGPEAMLAGPPPGDPVTAGPGTADDAVDDEPDEHPVATTAPAASRAAIHRPRP